MNARNKVMILLAVVFAISLGYYLLSTPRGSDLDLTGTVDANQVIVSPQLQGRIAKLLVDEGTRVKQGDLIAVLDPSELEAQARAAAAMIDSLRYQVAATQATSVATKGSTTGSVANAQAQLESARAQLLQAEATLQRVESDSRRTVELARQGVSSEQERVQAEANLKAQQALVASLKQQITAAQAALEVWPFVARAEISSLYAEHEIFVLPSLMEGMPLVLLEAIFLAAMGIAIGIPLGMLWMWILRQRFVELFSAGVIFSYPGMVFAAGG